jgi:hypothetical protein
VRHASSGLVVWGSEAVGKWLEGLLYGVKFASCRRIDHATMIDSHRIETLLVLLSFYLLTPHPLSLRQ